MMWYAVDIAVVVLTAGFFLAFRPMRNPSPFASLLALCLIILTVLAIGHMIAMTINIRLGITHDGAPWPLVALHELPYILTGAAVMWFWKEVAG